MNNPIIPADLLILSGQLKAHQCVKQYPVSCISWMDSQVRRSWTGSINPIPEWLYSGDHWQAIIHRAWETHLRRIFQSSYHDSHRNRSTGSRSIRIRLNFKPHGGATATSLTCRQSRSLQACAQGRGAMMGYRIASEWLEALPAPGARLGGSGGGGGGHNRL